MIESIRTGTAKLDYGPVQMSIQIKSPDKATELAEAGAKHAVVLLTQLAQYKHIAKKRQADIDDTEKYPSVLRRMIEAVRLSGDTELTPMAAVAGAMADLTAEWLIAQGATKAIINNGGDIAIRLIGKEHTSVGIVPALGMFPTHMIRVNAGTAVGGITTSGLGGRSFTKGIATAAVVAAPTAAFADACSTSLGNSTFANHANIKRILAEILDPDTDIAGHWVVTEVGDLPSAVVQEALYNGKQRAERLYQSGLIQGAAIFVQEECIMVPCGFIQPAS